jgi:hypothetical protein
VPCGSVVICGDQFQNLALAIGQTEIGLWPGHAREHLEDGSCDARRHGRTAGHHLMHRFHDPLKGRRFEQIARGARADRPENPLVILEHRQHHDARSRTHGLDFAQSFNPVHAGKLHVQ